LPPSEGNPRHAGDICPACSSRCSPCNGRETDERAFGSSDMWSGNPLIGTAVIIYLLPSGQRPEHPEIDPHSFMLS
jgi:hypothetical protein